MGKPIVYCGDCGRSLREEEFDRRRAAYDQHRPFCADCRPDLVPPEPKSERAVFSSSSARHRIQAAPRPSSSRPLIVAATAAALLVLALVVAFSSRSEPVAPPRPPAVAAPLKPVPPPPPPPLLRTAAPARAPEAPPSPPKNPAAVLERFLADIRSIRADDSGFRRADEVRAMLRRAAELAGPRKAEIDALLAGYEKEIAAAAAPPPPPALNRILGFTLIDADTEKPVPGHDPLVSGAQLDLGMLGLRRIDVRVNMSLKDVGSLETVVGGGKPRGESSYPYSFTNNSVAEGFDGWTPGPGRLELKCRVWSEKNRKGQAGPWTTLTLVIVDPR